MITPEQLHILDVALAGVREEAIRACSIHPPFTSTHEAAGVLTEEFLEVWEEVRNNNPIRMVEEAQQVAAVAVRIMMAVPSWGGGIRKL